VTWIRLNGFRSRRQCCGNTKHATHRLGAYRGVIVTLFNEGTTVSLRKSVNLKALCEFQNAIMG
jgi:hypothetical protein